MFDPNSIALPLPGDTAAGQRGSNLAVDVTVPHRFWFGKRRLFTALGRSIQAALLLGSGVFLLTQASSTPNLVVQMAILGTLLSVGGVAMLLHAVGTCRTKLVIDTTGVRARLGWRSCAIPWSRLELWKIADPQKSAGELPGITLSALGRKRALVVPSGYLVDQDRDTIRQLFRTFAYAKEDN